MKFTARHLCEQFSNLVIDSWGTEAEFSRIDSVDEFYADSLIFLNEQSSAVIDAKVKPAVTITNEKLAADLPIAALCVIVVGDVRLAQSLIKQHYADYDSSDPEWDAIHSSCIIHPDAKLGRDVRIGPNTVIGKDVEIGDRTRVRANCVVEHGVKIGDDCVINNLANIGYDCILGDRVIIRPGVVIGSEGFGFAQDELKHYHRIPHTGIVELHDDVQIGSNSNIDRATYGKTIVSRGVKIDALCHIAHNVFIDEDAIFIAQSGVAGSSKVGKRVIASGQTGVIDHRTIVDDAVLVHRCGVTEDVTEAGMWAGTPPRPFKEYVRNLSLAKKIKKLEQQIQTLESKESQVAT